MAYTEEQTIAALERLAANWPKGYTLYSWSGSLYLMKNSLMPKEIGLGKFDGTHNDAIVGGPFSGIRNEGGDPD